MYDLQKNLLSFLQGQMVYNQEIPALNNKAPGCSQIQNLCYKSTRAFLYQPPSRSYKFSIK